MIYAVYLIIAASVVWCSIRASKYVDIMEKHTTLSGAFIGGVVLSAVTSLPELFTSLTSTMLLDKPGLAIGNILGSNIFNCAMLAAFVLLYYRNFTSFKIAKSHIKVMVTVAAVYGALFLNMAGFLNLEYLSVNIASVVIVALYIYGVFHMSAENAAKPEPPASLEKLSLKEVKRRFSLAAIGLVLLSIILTYLTDGIATRHNLGEGLAGALFLGVATSLPEAASTLVLFRLGSYNIAVGNIVGSNLFNFLILAFADITYIGKGVYDYSDPKTFDLLIFGTLANLILLRLIWDKEVRFRWLCPILIIACYAAFLLM